MLKQNRFIKLARASIILYLCEVFIFCLCKYRWQEAYLREILKYRLYGTHISWWNIPLYIAWAGWLCMFKKIHRSSWSHIYFKEILHVANFQRGDEHRKWQQKCPRPAGTSPHLIQGSPTVQQWSGEGINMAKEISAIRFTAKDWKPRDHLSFQHYMGIYIYLLHKDIRY